MNNKLIVLEGSDGIGKSTQVKIISKMFNAQQIIQPSDDNCLWFLRDEVKNNEKHKPFERQLLHTCSHIVDAFSKLKNISGIQNYILDRSHASAYVYGSLQKMESYQIDLIMEIHKNVYNEVLNNFDVEIVFLDKDCRYDPKETDKFEESIDWNKLRAYYNNFYNYLKTSKEYLFLPKERIHQIKVDDLSVEQVTNEICKAIVT